MLTDTNGSGFTRAFGYDVLVMGGCGHVGLPLGLALADRGLTVRLYDRRAGVVEQVNRGAMPFYEAGADVLLPALRDAGRLAATTDACEIRRAENVIVVVGT